MKKKLTMLVIDDVEVNRALLRDTFQTEYEVMEAWDGLTAMETLHRESIDIVILDLCMPNMDGEEVLCQMKADRRLKTIPVVVKTAMESEIEEKMLEMGADDFIFSPCNPAVLRKRVGNIVRKCILEREIMQKKIADEQNQNKVWKEFIARMYQELNKPIDTILKLAGQRSFTGQDFGQEKSALQRITEQIKYLQELTNDMLDMSAIDGGTKAFGSGVFLLNAVVANVSGEYYAKCRERKIDFSVEISDVMHETLAGDWFRVRQILNGLLSDAYKNTADGGRICASFSERMTEEDRLDLEISVENSGGTVQNIEPVLCGLGINTVKSMAELLGGRFESEEDRSGRSRFSVVLPFEVGEEASVHRKKFNAMTAMLVDDDEIARNYHTAILARLGIQCTAVGNTETALNLLWGAYEEGKGYDICFVNWYMKEGCGKDAVKKIRRMFDRDTVLLVSSFNGTEADESDMQNLSVDYILKKPVFQSDLYQLMKNICRDAAQCGEKPGMGYDFNGKKVLIAEDNAINAEVLMGYLRDVNLQCDWVRNGKKAVEQYIKAGSGYYQAVLMDISMPILDGISAVKEIRKCEENGEKKIPVIAVTANAFPEGAEKVYAAGMDGYVAKPVDAKVLYHTISNIFSESNV